MYFKLRSKDNIKYTFTERYLVLGNRYSLPKYSLTKKLNILSRIIERKWKGIFEKKKYFRLLLSIRGPELPLQTIITNENKFDNELTFYK